MKNLTLILLPFIILSACSNQKEPKQVPKIEQVSDPIIGKQNITDEIAGSAYRKRATAYFVVIENDTSAFMPIFYETKGNGQVNIGLYFTYRDTTKTYLEQLDELKLILPEASKEYKIDSLNSLRIGRLISTGGLAVSITEAYKQKFGEDEKVSTTDYNKVSDFLLESRLAKYLNRIFEPYATKVESVSVEKVFFSDKKYLMGYSLISKDTANIPDRILDCSTWVSFQNK